MFTRVSLIALFCSLSQLPAVVAQEVYLPKIGDVAIGDVVTVSLEPEVAATWFRMLGDDERIKEGVGVALPAIVTYVHKDGRFCFDLSSTNETEEGETRLVTINVTLSYNDPAIKLFRKPAGTLVYRSPNDPQPVASEKESKSVSVSLAKMTDLKIRCWTLAEEIEPNK